MERAERCFQRIFVGYASFYQLLLLLECAVQYVSGSARSFATHNALLNGLLLLMSLCAMFRLCIWKRGDITGSCAALRLCGTFERRTFFHGFSALSGFVLPRDRVLLKRGSGRCPLDKAQVALVY